MATGTKASRRVQLGKEPTAGTAVVATSIWRGIAVGLGNSAIKINPDENVGLKMKTTRQYTAQVGAMLALPSTAATYEQAGYIFDSAISKETPVQDGVGTGYVTTWNFPHGTERAVTDVQTYTVEAGDSAQAREMEYSFVRDFTLEWKAGDAWKISATLEGRQRTKTTFTGSLSLSAVEEITAAKLYIDAVSGSFGATEKTCTMTSVTLKITSGMVAIPTANGELYFCEIYDAGLTGTLDFTFLHNTNAEAQEDNYDADTPILVRIMTEGSALATPGTYTYKTLIIDSAGVFSSFDSSGGDENGIATATASMTIGYDETADDSGKIIIVNELSVLP